VAPALALLGTSTASAATIAVSNTNDSGSGSLRDALATASSGDTIDLSGLTGAIQPLTPLSVPTNVSIIGPGAGNLTIEGGYLAGGSVLSMFMVDGGNGLTTFSDITLSGVTVGSAIHCINHPDLDLAIDSVVITGNTNPTDQGGGIYVSNCGSVEITDSEFSDNTSLYSGAGVFIRSISSALETVTITGSTFDNNTTAARSSNYYYSSGGGLWVSAYTVDITDSSFTNNYAYYQGAGAFLKSTDRHHRWLRLLAQHFQHRWGRRHRRVCVLEGPDELGHHLELEFPRQHRLHGWRYLREGLHHVDDQFLVNQRQLHQIQRCRCSP